MAGPQDPIRARAQLAGLRRALWRAQVIEQAEDIIRCEYRRMRAAALDEVTGEVERAQHLLEAAATSDNVAEITAALERLREIRRQLAFLLRQSGQEDGLSQQAEAESRASISALNARIVAVHGILHRRRV